GLVTVARRRIVRRSGGDRRAHRALQRDRTRRSGTRERDVRRHLPAHARPNATRDARAGRAAPIGRRLRRMGGRAPRSAAGEAGFVTMRQTMTTTMIARTMPTVGPRAARRWYS